MNSKICNIDDEIDLGTLESIVDLMLQKNVAELKFGELYVKMGSTEFQPQSFTDEEMKDFESSVSVSEEDILMDPYAGLSMEGR